MDEKKISQLIDYQKGKLLQTARKIIPHVTPDDILQPNDFAELENNPEFRYEEGILHGLQMALVSLRI